jgi:hypothetical protein
MLFARSLTLVLHLISHTIGLTGAASMRAYLFEDFANMVRTPIEIWQLDAILWPNNAITQSSITTLASQAPAAKVLYHLVRKSNNWSVLQHPPELYFLVFFHYGYYKVIAGIVNLEDIDDREFSLGLDFMDIKNLTSPPGLDEDDSLLRAIYRNSSREFRHCINDLEPQRVISSLDEAKYYTPLLAWFEGLQIIIESGLISPKDPMARELWIHAINTGECEPLKVLLQFGVQVKLQDWYNILRTWDYVRRVLPWAMSADHNPGHTAGHTARCSDVLDGIAKGLVPSSVVSGHSMHTDISHRIDIMFQYPPLFHTEYLTVTAAESAWKAGCRNMDSEHWVEGDKHRGPACTPLWIVSTLVNEWKTTWPLATWLLDHGADPTWTHPVYSTSYAHNFARQATRAARSRTGLRALEDISHLLIRPGQDLCKCACSEAGCYALGCAVQECIRCSDFMAAQVHYLRHQYVGPSVHPYFFGLVQQGGDAVWMSSAILRVLTFEKLSLTHTCCYQLLGKVDREYGWPRPVKAGKVILDLERSDIDLLNTLVADFEVKWEAYQKPFVTFMNRVWKPRMREIREETRKRRESKRPAYEAAARNVGVVLENSVESESDSDWADWPDDSPEGDADGWYTTDGEDADDVEGTEEENGDVGSDRGH